MFCPNCGTQNEDTANNCTKCGFNLKGTAAPKFKGTMLMMNVPAGLAGAAATVPAPAPALPAGSVAAPAAPVVTPASAAAKAKFKGTMLGVAPPSMGAAPAPPIGTPIGGPPTGFVPAGFPAPQAVAVPAANPPVTHPAAVNPLGGTMVADAGAFSRPGAYGTPPAAPQPAWSAPTAQTAPAAPAYGQPPQASAPEYGQLVPVDSGYGASPAYGAAPEYSGGALSPYGADPLGPTSPGAPGVVGNIRNPVNDTVFGAICGFYAAYVWITGILELKAFRQKNDINILFLLVPILNLIFLWGLTAKMLDAKRLAGIAGAQVGHPIIYFVPIYGLYAFIVDLNEVFRAASGDSTGSYG